MSEESSVMNLGAFRQIQTSWPSISATPPQRHSRHLYLQSASSFIQGECWSKNTEPPQHPVLSLAAASASLRLEVDLQCDVGSSVGLVWLNLGIEHPRYSAFGQANRRGALVQSRESYDEFNDRLQALCMGMLCAKEAKQLAGDLVLHVMQLSGSGLISVDPRVRAAMNLCSAMQVKSITDIAPNVGLSASRLSHLFSDETGVSFRKYLLWKRTTQAWRMVAQGVERSLTDIAHETGFADLSHMSNAFRAVYGYRPSALRKPAQWLIRKELVDPIG